MCIRDSTGTLDPLATGIMLVCVGRATKLASDLEAKDKIYIADFDIGYATAVSYTHLDVYKRQDIYYIL